MGKSVCLPDAGTLAVTDAQAADMLGVTVDFVREHVSNGSAEGLVCGWPAAYPARFHHRTVATARSWRRRKASLRSTEETIKVCTGGSGTGPGSPAGKKGKDMPSDSRNPASYAQSTLSASLSLRS